MTRGKVLVALSMLGVACIGVGCQKIVVREGFDREFRRPSSTVNYPFDKYSLPSSNKDVMTWGVDVKYDGRTRIKGVYGQEGTEAPPSSAYLSGGGKGFGLSSGWVYLTGYWRYLETERIRSITWGGTNREETRMSARITPEFEYTDDAGDIQTLPDRDQVFVLAGSVWVFPNNPESSTAVLVEKGEYVWASREAGSVQIKGPFPIPTSKTPPPPDAADIVDFLALVEASL